jgi:hypothetical protein
LALHLAFESKVNDLHIWRAIEESALTNLHLMNLTQVCQLEWASLEMKPKHTTARFNTMLMNRAIEAIDKASAQDLMNILQGFRKASSKDIYMRIRKTIIHRRNTLLPSMSNEKDQVKNAEMLANFFFVFASNIPKIKGVYSNYFREDINELLSHYEEDLKEAALVLDGEHLTRLAQTLYIFKTNDYEPIFWRIEDRVNELKDKLDIY